MRKAIIDLTHHEEIFDLTSDSDFSENLINTMNEVSTISNTQEQLFKIFLSKVNYHWEDIPTRYPLTKIVWYKKLTEYRKKTFNEHFSIESLESKVRSQNLHIAFIEKEWQRRWARLTYPSITGNNSNQIEKSAI